jgi:FkbM family methyltransferase
MATNLISNIIKGISYRTKKSLSNPFNKLGLNSLTVKFLKHRANQNIHTIKFLKEKISFSDGKEFLYGVEEIFINEIYKIDLPDNALILDCGANIGLSVIYFKMLNPSARIIAFEPDSKNFELLSNNVKSFNLNSVELRKEAVWIENTQLSFQNDGNMGSKIISQLDDNAHYNNINAVRLKDFITEPVAMLKIDIEGAEYQVVKDIQDALGLVRNIFLEYHGTFAQNPELVEILQILTLNGFSYYIKEATPIYTTPFLKSKTTGYPYDVQLNIFCIKLK